MKAMTFASLSALALAGAACSQSNEATDAGANAGTQPVIETVSAEPQDSGFNMSILTDGDTASTNDTGFNFSLDDIDSEPTDSALNLMDALPGAVELDDLPTVEPIQEPVIVPKTLDIPEDDEPLILIDPK